FHPDCRAPALLQSCAPSQPPAPAPPLPCASAKAASPFYGHSRAQWRLFYHDGKSCAAHPSAPGTAFPPPAIHNRRPAPLTIRRQNPRHSLATHRASNWEYAPAVRPASHWTSAPTAPEKPCAAPRNAPRAGPAVPWDFQMFQPYLSSRPTPRARTQKRPGSPNRSSPKDQPRSRAARPESQFLDVPDMYPNSVTMSRSLCLIGYLCLLCQCKPPKCVFLL